MQKVADIAKWFLSREEMTHKKVQKLCYYAQAWHCALFCGEALFEETIEAWIHGPVIPALYPIYADYKWSSIPMQEFDDSKFDEKAKAVLEAVYQTYGQYNGDQLESLTHSEEPWNIARGDCKPWEACTNIISIDSMKRYYSSIYERDQND